MVARRHEPASERRLRVGAVGLGRAFSLMLPTFARHPAVEIVAGADPRPEARARFAEDFSGARAYATVAELCRDGTVEAVYVSSPHQCHAEHAVAAAESGKHVLVEKPMALTLAECAAMIEAAHRNRVRLVVGHSHSFDAPVRRTRELVAGGALGALRMITAVNYTDFLYRPRRPEELSTDAGGGVIFNQAPHQVDVVRLIGGGQVRSVRAFAGAWDRRRPTEGAYSALLQFANGVGASLTYSGYAHFDSDEFCDWISESGERKERGRYGATRRLLAGAATLAGEGELKARRNYGGADYAAAPAAEPQRWHQHFGLLIASCEGADLRPLPHGVMVYGDEATRLEALPPPAVPRTEVIDELVAAIFLDRAPLHGGEWGMATVEVCLALLRSAREHKEIVLRHQVGVPEVSAPPAPAAVR
jgi:phthalate 4,5-cis-dihydrodiol dehydrogenase